jgi:trehalose 6-phosphate phosphatase
MVDHLPVPAAGEAAWALFLDVDGTLLELAEHPDLVVVPEGLVPLLARLKESLGGALALVSGRSLAALDALLGEAGLDAAGCHGAEMRIGGRAANLAVADSLVPGLAERLAHRAEGIPLAMVEIKSHSVAFHYRPPSLDAARARALVAACLEDLADRFRLLDGKQVVEALPVGAGKGEAIAHFLDHSPYAGRRPVFVGDDVTDEEGFREVNRRGGLSIRVGGTGATEAVFRAASVREVAEWLDGSVLRNLRRA